MEKTDSLLAPVLRRLGIEDGVRLARIQSGWNSIFDAPLRQHMFPFRLSEGELLINVESPLWMQQLSFCKRDVLAKLAPFGVRDVRFRVGRTYRVQERKEPLPKRQLSAEDRRFIEDLAGSVADDDLSAAVKAAAERSLCSAPPRPTRPASRK